MDKKGKTLTNRDRLNRGKALTGRVAILGALALSVGVMPLHAADQWMKPTPEELSMTSVPGHPGASAVFLLREQITRDDLHVVQEYDRIKVLTEEGKKRANVELSFVSSLDDGDYLGDDKEITDISGRTIHPDGTVIPFTGKPYLKMMQKGKNYKYQARVFTLPDVEIGSIIEYRYATRFSDYAYEPAEWYIQNDLFIKTAHFMWFPTQRELVSSEGAINSITWFPILPAGTTLGNRETPGTGPAGQLQRVYEVTLHDVAPVPEEEFMPPIRNFSYRVLFAYSPFRTPEDFWKSEGKRWSKREDSFIGPDNTLKEATRIAVAGAETPDQKLHKIYAAVMALENTTYTRDRDRNEEKAEGIGRVSSAGDVYKRGRGTSNQLTAVFIGMARAAGLKSYAMLVPDRSKRLLTAQWLSFNQFDNIVAIVNVDGKEQFFDPGERYCQYGQLAWENTFAHGLRQTENGTDFATAPSTNYTETKTQRIASLNMDAHGEVTGTVNITYTGSTALRWRHRALSGDQESLHHALRTSLEETLPKTLEVKVLSVDNISDYEKPLVAHFEVKGGLGTTTGKRMILPIDVFLADSAQTFPHEKRDIAVYFNYPETVQDAVRIKFPPTMAVEAVPTETKTKFHESAQYNMSVVSAPGSFTAQRTYLLNAIIVQPADYNDLRAFYSQMESKDKDSVVLKLAPENASANSGGN